MYSIKDELEYEEVPIMTSENNQFTTNLQSRLT